MEKQLIKEFILEIYDISSKEWKERIKEKFPELFRVEFEIGRWYKGTIKNGNKIFVRAETIPECGIIGKGFCTDGTYQENTLFGNAKNIKWELATETEIEPLLWKEANNRGIFMVTKLEKPGIYLCPQNKGDLDVFYDQSNDRLWNINGTVYEKGQWATPLDPKKEIMEEIKKLSEQIDELYKQKRILESKLITQ